MRMYEKTKVLGISLLSLICAMLMGCAMEMVTVTDGTHFTSTQVYEIKKGVTTTSELIAMFGQPYSKLVKSTDEAEWLFRYVTVTSPTSFISTSAPNSNIAWHNANGYRKLLKVFIRNDVVIDYEYNEEPFYRMGTDRKTGETYFSK